MSASRPELPQRASETQLERRGSSVVKRGSEVVVLALEQLDENRLLARAGSRFCVLRECDEVSGVRREQRVALLRVGHDLVPELANRLEHPIAAVAVADKALVDQRR